MVPLLAEGVVVGVLLVASASRTFGEADQALAEELAHRCAAFVDSARMHRAVRRAVRARDEMLGVVAHDLRNPLHAIGLQAAVLERLSRGSGPELAEAAASVRAAVRRMGRLLDDLLDVARLDAGTLALERRLQPLEPILLAALEAHQGLARDRGVALRADLGETLPPAWTDAHRLRQVLDNLLGNALRFTREGSVTLGAQRGRGTAELWVEDTGPGVAPADQPRVFDRFWRGAPSDGAGLGLAIARGVVEAHGGRIWLESVPGSGATFWVSLPAAG